MKWFRDKRYQVARSSLPAKSALIVASLPEYFRQVDIKYPYRQESNFYYLTGFEQANSLFLLFPSGRSVLFIEDKDPIKETWEGRLYSTQEVKKDFLIPKVYPLSQIHRLPDLLKETEQLFYDKLNSFFDKKIKGLRKKLSPAGELIKAFRRIKDPKREIPLIKKAISISVYGHQQVAKALKPGISERALHGIFIKSIMEKGSPREAYGGIFACGQNAITLHYIQNHSVCKKGELLLVDAGAEVGFYSSDITRVYPVSGRWTKKQRHIYSLLLSLQKKLIESARPGVSLKSLNQKMAEGLTEIFLSIGLLKGSWEKHIKDKSFRKYCPHSVGHLLGLDTHDVSFNLKKGEEGILKPYMVLTIEPGIYISKTDKEADPDIRGMGLRIEDDILITPRGQQNLSKALTKEPDEIEALCQSLD